MKVINTENWFAPYQEVDIIVIDLTSNLKANSDYGPPLPYHGDFGRAHLTAQINITSLCPPNMYGPHCTTKCTDVSGERVCNYLGVATTLNCFEEHQDTCTPPPEKLEEDKH